jgi:hypothetical protein
MSRAADPTEVGVVDITLDSTLTVDIVILHFPLLKLSNKELKGNVQGVNLAPK